MARFSSRTAPSGLVVLTCAFAAAPLWPQGFTDEADARGVVYWGQQDGTFGTGLVFADLDEDGDPDLVTVGALAGGLGPTTLGLFENDGNGYFTHRSLGSGIPPTPDAAGVSAGDYDGDGDLDLFVSCWLVPDVLLRNDGGFQFTDMTAEPGFALMADDGAGSASGWADYDNDGWLDLYLCNRTGTSLPDPPYPPSKNFNRLYRNLGGAGFEELAVPLGVDGDNDLSFCSTFFDYDRDGDADLYLSNDHGLSSGCTFRNRFWENTGGGFLDISASSGTDGCINAMCSTVGDFDGNLLQDIYVTNDPAGNFLYLNNGDGTFTSAAGEYGVLSNAVGWGSTFFDYDNDGWMDLYVCQHRSWEPNRLYDFGGSAPAVDVAAALGVDDTGESFCCAVADIDGDGDLDLALSNMLSRVRLFVNHMGSQRSWVKFRVAGEGANTWGIGTNVEILADGHAQLREVIAGNGFKTQDDLVLHFGLNEAEQLDRILVDWPGGTSRVLTGYAARHTWTLHPPARLGDADGDGRVGAADLQAFWNCFAAGAPFRPGCEIFDMDGDGGLDLADLRLMQARADGDWQPDGPVPH